LQRIQSSSEQSTFHAKNEKDELKTLEDEILEIIRIQEKDRAE
jgi:hypothetical protein